MKVTFLHHSSFAVELPDRVLVFDYFNGDRVNGYNFNGKLPEYPSDTAIYFFASHKHQDHFDMDILRLIDRYPNVRYILSKDTKLSPNFLKKHGIDPAVRSRITYVTANAEYEVDGMKIRTLLSTDAGVAFFITVDGKKIYHAGDLHNWKWDGAGDLINGRMERGYKHALQVLEDEYLDLAFIVLDPRLDNYKFKGFDYFLKTISAKYVFPMHMWQEYGILDEYLSHVSNPNFIGRIMKLEQENQMFELD